MKWIKRILAVMSFLTLLTVSRCFATTLVKTDTANKENELYRTYTVKNIEENNFLESIKKNVNAFGNEYIFDSYTTEDNINTETINIETSKTITLKSNNRDTIISQLGETIPYNENGYTGEYYLDEGSLSIKTNYNGFKEVLIEKTINYSNLERNDLDFIPKTTEKDGLELKLLNIDWQVESTKKIGEKEVPDKYTAICYYAEKQRINYPNTYTVTGYYSGTANKEYSDSKTYIVKYFKVVPEVVDEPVVEEEKDNSLLPIAGGSTGIILIIFFLTRNVTVYNLKDGQYKKIGKTRIRKNNTINLNKFTILEQTNKYKLEFSKGLTKKLNGKMITVSKNRANIKMLVNATDNSKYTVEVRI